MKWGHIPDTKVTDTPDESLQGGLCWKWPNITVGPCISYGKNSEGEAATQLFAAAKTFPKLLPCAPESLRMAVLSRWGSLKGHQKVCLCTVMAQILLYWAFNGGSSSLKLGNSVSQFNWLGRWAVGWTLKYISINRYNLMLVCLISISLPNYSTNLPCCAQHLALCLIHSKCLINLTKRASAWLVNTGHERMWGVLNWKSTRKWGPMMTETRLWKVWCHQGLGNCWRSLQA